MRLPHHLLRHVSGVFHFRLTVHQDLRALVGLRVIKRSLQTRDMGHAQVAAWHLGNPAEVEKFARGEKSKIAKRTGWKPFTTEQLRHLFAPAKLEQTEMPHTRRAMIIGLYTGARVGEVAQLELSYFTDVGGVPCMRFDGELKTDASERVIPIHPDLIRLGLLEWVSARRSLPADDGDYPGPFGGDFVSGPAV